MAKKKSETKLTEAEREKLIDEIVELFRQLGLVMPDDDTETGDGCGDMTGSGDTKTA